MSFTCSHCDAAIDAPYEWGGLPLACPACGQVAPLGYRIGQRIDGSASGYGVTYRDFVRLLDERAPPVDALVTAALACTIRREGATVLLVTSGDGLIPLLSAHLRLQGDVQHQRRLYGLAMDLWR